MGWYGLKLSGLGGGPNGLPVEFRVPPDRLDSVGETESQGGVILPYVLLGCIRSGEFAMRCWTERTFALSKGLPGLERTNKLPVSIVSPRTTLELALDPRAAATSGLTANGAYSGLVRGIRVYGVAWRLEVIFRDSYNPKGSLWSRNFSCWIYNPALGNLLYVSALRLQAQPRPVTSRDPTPSLTSVIPAKPPIRGSP